MYNRDWLICRACILGNLGMEDLRAHVEEVGKYLGQWVSEVEGGVLDGGGILCAHE